MTNEKQLENQEKVKMPWQGKVWIGMVFFTYIFSLFLVLNDYFDFPKYFFRFLFYDILNLSYSFVDSLFGFLLAQVALLSPFFASFVTSFYFLDNNNLFLFLTFLIIFIGLNIVILWGFLNGKKGSILIYAIYYSFLFFVVMFSEFNFLILLVTSFLVYLLYSCLKSPYFNQNKAKQNKNE